METVRLTASLSNLFDIFIYPAKIYTSVGVHREHVCDPRGRDVGTPGRWDAGTPGVLCSAEYTVNIDSDECGHGAQAHTAQVK